MATLRKGTETVGGQLRAAIVASGSSLNEISRATGVNPSILSRFVRGQRGLDLSSIDKLASHLRLRLVKANPGQEHEEGR